MSAAILANMAILLLAILLFFFLRKGKVLEDVNAPLEQFCYFVGVTVVGILLMRYSVVVSGARYDYRFLLYALSIKYLGPKVTLPSIGVITLFRFVWGVDVYSLSALAFGVILMLTIGIMYNILKKYVGPIQQVVGLILYIFAIRIVLNVIIYKNIARDFELYMVLVASSIVMFGILFVVFSRIVQIQERSEIDFLTKLRNSRRFYQDISDMKRETKEMVLSVIDIDYFKQVNTVYGHLAGDHVLQLVTKAFLEFERDSFVFYRMGGEEFTCLIYGKSLEEAKSLLETLREEVSQLDSGLKTKEGTTFHVTFSAGVTTVNRKNPITEALEAADKALFKAKDNGRNQLVVADQLSTRNGEVEWLQ